MNTPQQDVPPQRSSSLAKTDNIIQAMVEDDVVASLEGAKADLKRRITIKHDRNHSRRANTHQDQGLVQHPFSSSRKASVSSSNNLLDEEFIVGATGALALLDALNKPAEVAAEPAVENVTEVASDAKVPTKVSSVPPEKRLKMAQVRQYILAELLETEVNYVANLGLVISKLKMPLVRQAMGNDTLNKLRTSRESLTTLDSAHSSEKEKSHIKAGELSRSHSTSTKQIIPMVDIKIIFAWIEELLEFNKTFCEELTEVVNSLPQSEAVWDKLYNGSEVPEEELVKVKSIGTLFQEQAEGLKVYLRFVDNYSAAKEAIRRSEENSAAYRQFMADNMKDREFTKQGIADFLILPIQRVTRYVLLLQDFKKHVPTDHPDYENIVQAFGQIRQLANTVNEVKRNEEEMTQMFHIVRTVQDVPPTIISAQRRLLLECEGSDVTRDNIMKAFSPMQVGNSGISMVPSMATIQSTKQDSSSSVDSKEKDISLIRLYLFSDVFIMAKAKGKKKWTMTSSEKEQFQLFRIGWIKDLEVVELEMDAEALEPTAKKFFSMSSAPKIKYHIKIVIHESDAGNPVTRKKFYAELQESNQSLLKAARAASTTNTAGQGTNQLKRQKTLVKQHSAMAAVIEQASPVQDIVSAPPVVSTFNLQSIERIAQDRLSEPPPLPPGRLQRSSTVNSKASKRTTSLVPLRTDIPSMVGQISFETTTNAGLITTGPSSIASPTAVAPPPLPAKRNSHKPTPIVQEDIQEESPQPMRPRAVQQESPKPAKKQDLPEDKPQLSRSMSMGHRSTDSAFTPKTVTETFVLELSDQKQKSQLTIVWAKLQKKLAGNLDDDFEIE